MEDEDFDRDDIEIDYDDYGGYGWTGEDDEDIDSLIEDICPNCGSDNVRRTNMTSLCVMTVDMRKLRRIHGGMRKVGADTPEALLINGICLPVWMK